MSSSSPVGTPDTSLELHDDTASKRRVSRRVRAKPEFHPDNSRRSEASNGVKRKRGNDANGSLTDDDTDGESSPGSESDPDEEELKEARRKARSSAKKAPSKKPKTTTLAMRPAVNEVKKAARAPSRAKSARPPTTGINVEDEIGLFAEVFSRGHTSDGVAADWIHRWDQDNTQAMTDLVNFVIRCTGCRLTVTVHDIEDPDNAVSKLTDLQDEYTAQGPSDYPLISRLKSLSSFRPTVVRFVEDLIQSCHASGLLYTDPAIIENIEVWISSMSSAGLRPFRHTATVISLAVGTQLCRVAADLSEQAAKLQRQKEGEEKKKKGVNKQRIKEFNDKLQDLERKTTSTQEYIRTVVDAVFVHRYRDIDPKIRAECVSALGTWVTTLPDVFFEAVYLRYFGWILFDTVAATRAEVIKQLTKMYKNKENVARLRTFTERYRSRLVEMGLRDSEVGIRASAVELLGLIRETALLEPDDIDNVGRLIFDNEPRVRKAVSGFFAENINDIYENSIEELGGEEALADILGDGPDGDHDVPQKSWLKLKSVVEALQSYDAEDDESSDTQQLRAGLLPSETQSRYALAAQTICDGISAAQDWETISGYLLYDLSATTNTLEERCQLSEKEEILLLEILNVSVNKRIKTADEAQKDGKTKRNRSNKTEAHSVREATALHLAKVILDLLKKFGSNAATASAVLRLGRELDLEIFQELRQDSTTYAALLDDINKQFLTHSDSSLLAEASTALLHARSFEELEEITQGKVQELWEDTINALRTRMSEEQWVDNISEICDTVRRIAHLSGIMDCRDVLQASSRLTSKPKKKTPPTKAKSAVDLLMDILREPALDSEAGQEADETVTETTKVLLLYYMWTVKSIQSARINAQSDFEPPDYSPFASALLTVIERRHATSPVRLAAIGALLDLHSLFATFRNSNAPLPMLVQPINTHAEPLILSTFTALEKSYGQKSHRRLEIADDEALDDEPEDDEEDDDDDDEEMMQDTRRQQEVLLAEKRLCELTGKVVLAVVARVLDHQGERKGRIRERISLNRLKLGNNFKEIIAYVDEPRPKQRSARPPRKASAPPKQNGKAKSKARISDDDEDSDEEVEHEEGGDEDIRARELEEDRIVDLDDEEENVVVGGHVEDDIEDEIMGD
ncbi:uncharacterized protein KY384_004761 [Bacidia gigantensis]|uniref:uncharacterized protein n=1 Tax=Bacidia gigantensis TaxID=2732470 RepID=UPI001D03A52C|nr:uncharacterized protein KY384_004761 [Bacidia gigantensis]KAG8530260.1 hypothetical protein KY384_004761 [Bacidia gigantensis]